MATKLLQPLTIAEKDRACIWHPFTQAQRARDPIPISRAKGIYLYTEDGSCYLDGISSWWVNLHGHAHPYIVEKIKAQAEVLEHVIFAGFTHSSAVELASRILEVLPGNMSKVFYSDNGSTAVEVALKMALQYWHNLNIPKTKIVCFKNGYHGDTFGAMSSAGRNEFNRPFWTHLFEVESINPPIIGQEETSLSQLKAILEKGDVACFIFEPLILGAGGMVMYSANGLNQLIQCCKLYEVLTIADEVMTGFGRTGTLFACDQLNQSPDLICLSKGITGGFLPLGATVCTEKIYNAFLSNHLNQAFLHGHSYTANPLACSSGLASLDLLLENGCSEQRKIIKNCHQNFCDQWGSHSKLKRCEVLGTILVLEYHSQSNSYFQSFRDQLYYFFLNKGILLRPLGNVLYILPPYCIQPDQLNFIYENIVLTLEGEL
jgi:adenosylmethionine-8-amino-7-oxononanoate aminotransferase